MGFGFLDIFTPPGTLLSSSTRSATTLRDLGAYTARSLRGLDPEDRRCLYKAGFPVPPSIRPVSKAETMDVEEAGGSLEAECGLTLGDQKAILEPFEAIQEGLEEIFLACPAVNYRDVLPRL